MQGAVVKLPRYLMLLPQNLKVLLVLPSKPKKSATKVIATEDETC